MRRLSMFLIGLVIGVALGWAGFMTLANYGIDYSLPHLQK